MSLQDIIFWFDDLFDRILALMKIDHVKSAGFLVKLWFRIGLVIGPIGFLITGNPTLLLAPLSAFSIIVFYGVLILFVEHFFVMIRIAISIIDMFVDLLIQYDKI